MEVVVYVDAGTMTPAIRARVVAWNCDRAGDAARQGQIVVRRRWCEQPPQRRQLGLFAVERRLDLRLERDLRTQTATNCRSISLALGCSGGRKIRFGRITRRDIR